MVFLPEKDDYEATNQNCRLSVSKTSSIDSKADT